jgi:hypothetical protein
MAVDLTEWPSVTEVRKRLDVSRPYVARLIATGRFGAVPEPHRVDQQVHRRSSVLGIVPLLLPGPARQGTGQSPGYAD